MSDASEDEARLRRARPRPGPRVAPRSPVRELAPPSENAASRPRPGSRAAGGPDTSGRPSPRLRNGAHVAIATTPIAAAPESAAPIAAAPEAAASVVPQQPEVPDVPHGRGSLARRLRGRRLRRDEDEWEGPFLPPEDPDFAKASRPRPVPRAVAGTTMISTQPEPVTAAAESSTEAPAVDGVPEPSAPARPRPPVARHGARTRPERRPRRSLRALVRQTVLGRWLTKVGILVVVVVAAALVLRSYVVAPYYIPSQSMEPTLDGCPGCSNDDHILVDKLSYRFHLPHAGDIVVFDKPAGLDEPDPVLVKRVIGVGGELLVLRGGNVYINGQRLSEPYINKACGAGATQPLTSTSRWLIPNNDVFVMGDNRCDSTDSRYFGPIPDSSIIGRAFVIVWPLKRFSFL